MKPVFIILTWSAGLSIILIGMAAIIYTIYITAFWWFVLAFIGFAICLKVGVMLIVIADDWYDKYLNWKEYIKNNKP